LTRVYSITMQTPIGIQRGKLTFITSGTILSGTLDGDSIHSKFNNGKIINNNFEFSGQLTKAFFNIPYYANGILNSNSLTGSVKTKYGTFIVKGNIIK